MTSDDVSNAVATSKVNLSLASSSSVSLVANLGDLPGYPREVMFVNSVTYMWTCVDFPDVADATPKVAPCSPQTVGAWNSEPNALNIARDAVAIAAKRGQAVSGSDVVKAAGAQRWRLATKPTFGSGLGGVVKFTNKSTSGFSGSKVTVTVNVCVQFPKTAYGIPLLVKC
ncbi:MAG: hypothetical protein HIU84_13875 [Acidobacteria bacterium]|nr:hypothetical protein [Acidobacteriota bacterium]